MPRPSSPPVAHTLKTLDRTLTRFRAAGETVALVPTMGALHAGHLTLVKRAKRKAKRVVVSIFVNPTQFAPNEDFSSYPRTLNDDVAALSELGVDLVWAPSPEVMYPDGFATRVVPEGPALAGLEDAFRPHFFAGVATVVSKLFGQVRPDFAMFGEKDFQQLAVVTRMAADLDLRVKIVPVPIVREKDGLARSSRNVYLSQEERARAPALHRTLQACAKKIAGRRPIAATLAAGRKGLEAEGFAVDYLEARHAETLAPITSRRDGPIRLLVAAKIGTTRLIDNLAV
ncbi:Pantoate--beta-alanine ligase [Rhodovulum sp. PH10]|uniref:pantoate--beta-alanine ligase n=1 Tax=Rhodovulum sp. PH10 TaxID=1187851 RepID=UPI00027C1EE0|nr:pantoate--beta-alanine ligase [Rhodovulum sp. PH10]EJW09737.1 Pantoate--beta-alanine ligase [Rhodovulum sp. PH10]